MKRITFIMVTLSNDGHAAVEFDFMLSNPPYGKSWKTDTERLGGKNQITDPRFVVNFAGDAEFKMIPRISDGQLLFLANNIAKMKHGTKLGSRIAEVHNGYLCLQEMRGKVKATCGATLLKVII